MTSFRFPSGPGTRPGPATLPASGSSPGASAKRFAPDTATGHAADKEGAIGARPVAPFGMLNVIAVPTAISAAPPAIRFGSLTIALSAALHDQITGERSECADALAVTAVLHGDGWQAQSCTRIARIPSSGGGVRVTQGIDIPELTSDATERSADALAARTNQKASPDLIGPGAQVATQTRSEPRGARPAAGVAESASTRLSFAPRPPSRGEAGMALIGESEFDLDKLQDIPI